MIVFEKSRLKWVWVTVTLVITWLTLLNVVAYFGGGPTRLFLIEKGELRFMPLWSTAFYFHIISSSVCLIAGPPLMIPGLVHRYRRLHAVLGYAYLNCVLWVSVPTGLVLSLYAKGGIASTLGFALTGVLWWWATWLGYRAIRQRKITAHICWMIRSYALALSAVVFRVVQQLMAFGPCSDVTNYIASLWISLLVSLWISENCIMRKFSRPPMGKGLSPWLPALSANTVYSKN